MNVQSSSCINSEIKFQEKIQLTVLRRMIIVLGISMGEENVWRTLSLLINLRCFVKTEIHSKELDHKRFSKCGRLFCFLFLMIAVFVFSLLTVFKLFRAQRSHTCAQTLRHFFCGNILP